MSVRLHCQLAVVGASLSEPQYSQEWYVHQVHENLLNKNDLSHAVAESRTHIPLTKVYRKNMACTTLLLNSTYVANTKFTERITVCPSLFLNGTYPTNTKFYEVLYLWQCVLRCLKHKIDCKECLQAI